MYNRSLSLHTLGTRRRRVFWFRCITTTRIGDSPAARQQSSQGLLARGACPQFAKWSLSRSKCKDKNVAADIDGREYCKRASYFNPSFCIYRTSIFQKWMYCWCNGIINEYKLIVISSFVIMNFWIKWWRHVFFEGVSFVLLRMCINKYDTSKFISYYK